MTHFWRDIDLVGKLNSDFNILCKRYSYTHTEVPAKPALDFDSTAVDLLCSMDCDTVEIQYGLCQHLSVCMFKIKKHY